MKLFGKKQDGKSFILLSALSGYPDGSILITTMDSEKIRNYIINTYRNALAAQTGIDISDAEMIGLHNWSAPLVTGENNFMVERMDVIRKASAYLDENANGVKQGSKKLSFCCINNDLKVVITFIQPIR